VFVARLLACRGFRPSSGLRLPQLPSPQMAQLHVLDSTLHIMRTEVQQVHQQTILPASLAVRLSRQESRTDGYIDRPYVSSLIAYLGTCSLKITY
jgi:hypothetical protein